jgi:hypothetical protein
MVSSVHCRPGGETQQPEPPVAPAPRSNCGARSGSAAPNNSWPAREAHFAVNREVYKKAIAAPVELIFDSDAA